LRLCVEIQRVPVSETIRKKLSAVPHKPGVYLHKDRFGTVIYVGKARDLRRRVSQYFQSSRRNGWDLKFNALVEAIHDFDIHVVKSEPESLLLESKLIKEFKPRFNIMLRDDKRFLMLKVNLNDPIPNFTFTRLKKDDGARYFGPFVNSTGLRNAVALARKQFNLRGCRVFTPGEADYRHCLYAHLKNCTAPCVNNVTREQYLEQVKAACDFLEGQCRNLEGELEAEMKKAAAAHDFEKAAQLRDLIRDLQDTWKRTEKFARVPYTLPLAINPAKDLFELGKVLGLSKPPERIEGFDISNISGTFVVASCVSFKNGRPDRANYRRFKIKGFEGQDDFASIAEVVRRRYSRLKKESKPLPDLILIDGGKGQLGMACEELKKLGLEKIPVIGLAKEFEEIYLPEKYEPFRLGLDHPAVKLLQRVRDECHRVANSFNAQLRLKKISESILDEFPGIGERRKAALLKKFGSVQRLKMATLEQLAEVPGFGGKAAAELKAFLDARKEVRANS
jgi:excinuclease ABC subunit C